MAPIFGGPESAPKGRRRYLLVAGVVFAGALLGFVLRACGIL